MNKIEKSYGKSGAHIAMWMLKNKQNHIDPQTGELNCTSLVEDWDNSESTGDATLDTNHMAWDIAVLIDK
jgi:hypothetical protein